MWAKMKAGSERTCGLYPVKFLRGQLFVCRVGVYARARKARALCKRRALSPSLTRFHGRRGLDSKRTSMVNVHK